MQQIVRYFWPKDHRYSNISTCWLHLVSPTFFRVISRGFVFVQIQLWKGKICDGHVWHLLCCNTWDSESWSIPCLALRQGLCRLRGTSTSVRPYSGCFRCAKSHSENKGSRFDAWKLAFLLVQIWFFSWRGLLVIYPFSERFSFQCCEISSGLNSNFFRQSEW